MSAISSEWKTINDSFHKDMADYIEFLENGGDIESNPFFKGWLQKVNDTQLALKENLKEKTRSLIDDNKTVGILGGEHSSPLGLLEVLNEKHKDFGILQIDAHADLRIAYEGFEQSHASIMYNALTNCEHITKLVQVGIRDISQGEVEFIESSNDRIKTFYDWGLKEKQYEGKTWKALVDDIIYSLPEKVYLSFDIDGLNPELCPSTGTLDPRWFYIGRNGLFDPQPKASWKNDHRF